MAKIKLVALTKRLGVLRSESRYQWYTLLRMKRFSRQIFIPSKFSFFFLIYRSIEYNFCYLPLFLSIRLLFLYSCRYVVFVFLFKPRTSSICVESGDCDDYVCFGMCAIHTGSIEWHRTKRKRPEELANQWNWVNNIWNVCTIYIWYGIHIRNIAKQWVHFIFEIFYICKAAWHKIADKTETTMLYGTLFRSSRFLILPPPPHPPASLFLSLCLLLAIVSSIRSAPLGIVYVARFGAIHIYVYAISSVHIVLLFCFRSSFLFSRT